MEFCSKTLTIILKQLKEELKLSQNDLLTSISYYIASELSIELLENVEFLYRHNPPIIHRDLKPDNILITNGINGRFIKIADFGLSTIHEFSQKTHTQYLGTFRLITPEVINGRKYDTKADIFSLGTITQDLFHIHINEEIRSIDIENNDLRKI
jgi:serine/threonine-protein kinase